MGLFVKDKSAVEHNSIKKVVPPYQQYIKGPQDAAMFLPVALKASIGAMLKICFSSESTRTSRCNPTISSIRFTSAMGCRLVRRTFIMSKVSKKNNSIARKIYYREELYKEPYLGNAPDLVMLSKHGFDLKGRVHSGKVFGNTNLSGMHTQDNAVFSSSAGCQCETIFDAKEIVLESL